MMTEQIIGHFAVQANNYENLMERIVPHYKKQHDEIYELLPEDSAEPLRVLDLGCGNGVLSRLVLQKLSNAYVVGFDLTPRMLAAYEASRRVAPRTGGECDSGSSRDLLGLP